MDKQQKQRPTMLAVGADREYLDVLSGWLNQFCDVIPTTRYGMAEVILKSNVIDIIVVEGFGKEMARAFKHKYSDTLVCLLTSDSYEVSTHPGIHCIQKSEIKKKAISSILNLWLLHQKDDERMKLIERRLDLLQVRKSDPQEKVEVLYMSLKENPAVMFESVALRHDDHPNQTNFCITLGRGCIGNCKMCATAKIKENAMQFSAEIMVSQVAHLFTTHTSVGCLHEDLTIAAHGGGDPRFNLNEYCRAIEILEFEYNLNAHYIATSIGSEHTFREMIRRLGSFDMSFELSAHSTDKDNRAWLMPETKNDSLSRMVEILSEDSIMTGRKNKYRHLIIKGFNDSPKDAKEIGELVANTPLRVILMKLEPGCLSEYPGIVTDKDVKDFQDMLADEGVIDVCHNKNLGEGMVKCGMHVDVDDRQEVEKSFMNNV